MAFCACLPFTVLLLARKSSSNSDRGLLVPVVDDGPFFDLRLCQIVNRCLHNSTNDVGDECRKVKRNRVRVSIRTYSYPQSLRFRERSKCLYDCITKNSLQHGEEKPQKQQKEGPKQAEAASEQQCCKLGNGHGESFFARFGGQHQC